MAKKVISREAAEIELERIVDQFETDTEAGTWKDSRAKLLASIERGRLSLDEEKNAIVISLAEPIGLENGNEVRELRFAEPTAGDLKVMDRYKATERMAAVIHLASKMSEQPVGIIERLVSRDLMTVGAIVDLFF